MSAVDVNVAHLIFHKCINGLLQNKTRILCTHHIQYLLSADILLVMDNGRITKQGMYYMFVLRHLGFMACCIYDQRYILSYIIGREIVAGSTDGQVLS